MRFGGTAEFGAFLWTKVVNKPPYCRYRPSCTRRDEARRLVVDGAALIAGKMTAKVLVAGRIVHINNRYLAGRAMVGRARSFCLSSINCWRSLDRHDSDDLHVVRINDHNLILVDEVQKTLPRRLNFD